MSDFNFAVAVILITALTSWRIKRAEQELGGYLKYILRALEDIRDRDGEGQ